MTLNGITLREKKKTATEPRDYHRTGKEAGEALDLQHEESKPG